MNEGTAPALSAKGFPRLSLYGPCDTVTDRASVTWLAGRLRRNGHDVTEPRDLARLAVTSDYDSVAFARAASSALSDADAVVLAPGWESDVHSCVTVELADVLGVPVFEWEDVIPTQRASA